MSVEISVGFGTSGVRGPAAGFTPAVVSAYIKAFLETTCQGAARTEVVIGADRRASSPRIVGLVAGAIGANGWHPLFAGEVPTPALADYALARSIPAIMVTGSHIPSQYNGLKFYKPQGELLKSDEGSLREAAHGWFDVNIPIRSHTPPGDASIALHYRDRFTRGFLGSPLRELKIGVFGHSAVGCDLMTEVLNSLGATCHVFGRQKHFVALDTEAVDEQQMAVMRSAIATHALDAVVSTDGDGDRPLLLDETGRQVNGDVLGALTARALGAATVVTPLNSTSAIESSGWFETVVRTRIGSPYVVAAMAQARGAAIVGFEPNGGFLLQTPISLPSIQLASLPTRDGLLPLIAVLSEANRLGRTVSGLVRQLPGRSMRADRLADIPPHRGSAFVAEMASSATARDAFAPLLGEPTKIDVEDGTRLVLADGRIIHFRQSGNAPELRCYVETASDEESTLLLSMMMSRLRHTFDKEA